MRPLPKLAIKDLNAEIQDRLKHLRPLESFGIVHAFKGRSLEEALKRGKVYGIGHSTRDIMTYLCTRLWNSLLAPLTDSGLESFNYLDTGGASRSLPVYTTSTTNLFNGGGTPTSVGTQLGFGNPATTPTPARDDYELASKVAQFDVSARIYNETLLRTTLTGSYVWVAGGTVREIGQYVQWQYGGSYYMFLMYHDAVSDVVVPPDGTVAVTYVTQY